MAAAAGVQAVLAQPATFEQLVGQLLLSDNEARKHAESVFDGLKEHPDACANNMMLCLRQSSSVEHRSFCAIMLRKTLLAGEPTMYQKCSVATQEMVKTQLLAALQDEQQKTVVKKVGDTISELAAELMDRKEWPQVIPTLLAMVQSGQAGPAEAALDILATLAGYITDDLRPSIPAVLQLLGACFTASSLDVQLAAARVVTSFVNSLDEAKERDLFQPTLPYLLTSLGTMLQAGEETSAQEVLELLIEVADQHPKFLRKSLVDVVSAVYQVGSADQFDEPTRSLAAEFLVTLSEAKDRAPGMVRKLPNFTAQVFEMMMGFLLDIEDEPLWHKGDSDQYEEEGAGELFDSGQEYLDRIAISMGGKALVPAAGRLLPAWLADADWKKRHAALICLAQIAEGCAKVMLEQVEPLVDMCLRGLQDLNAKVRWAACQALGQMCTDLGPDIQEKCGVRILPALIALMDDFANPRVQAHASAAIVNFSENAEPEVMGPHLDNLISKLLALLQQGQKLVQEGALTAMASVADCCQAQFVKYYDHVVPLLSAILVGAKDKQHRLLRAKALECISLVGMAVGRDRFRQDAQHVMTFLQQLMSTEMDTDDPTASYMLQAGARLCKCLGPEFLPYLGVVMPPLIKSAQLDADVQVRDDEDEDADDDVEHIQFGDKVLAIRTSVLEEKATACNMLCCYADELKEGFFPYVKQVTDIMVPLLGFYFHEEVRRAAVQALPQLLESAQLAAERGMAGADAGFLKQMVDYAWAPLMTALTKEPETDVQSSMLEALSEIVELLEPQLLSQPQVEEAFKAFNGTLQACEARRQQRNKQLQTEEFDEEEAEQLEAANEAEEDLLDNVGSAIGSFLKKFNDAVLPYVEALMPAVAPLLDKSRSEEERRIGLCIVDDLLEHSPSGRAKYAQQVMPVLLDSCLAEQSDLRQCAVYGLAVVAARSPDVFRPHAPAALQRIMTIIQHPESRSEDNEMATDNAVSALGRLLEHHSDALNGAAMADAWVAALPLKSDAVEACHMHELLVRLLEAQDTRVLGPGGKHVPHLIGAMVFILGRGTELVNAEVGPRMVRLLQALQSQAQEVAAAAFAGLSEKQKVRFQAWMAGQVPE